MTRRAFTFRVRPFCRKLRPGLFERERKMVVRFRAQRQADRRRRDGEQRRERVNGHRFAVRMEFEYP